PKLFLRQDLYGRFVTCLVFIPRERYTTHIRQHIQKILRQQFQALTVSFAVNLTEAPLARVLFFIRFADKIPIFNVQAIESEIAIAIRSWQDELQTALCKNFGEIAGCDLFEIYGFTFPAGYREDCSVQRAVLDIKKMQVLESKTGALQLELSFNYQDQLRLRIYRRNIPLLLYQALPIFKNMGVNVEEERPHKITWRDSSIDSLQKQYLCESAPKSNLLVWIHDFSLSHHGSICNPNNDLETRFQDAIMAIWQQQMADDGFNALIIQAGLNWHQVVLLRTYARYMRQTTLAFSQTY
ncbi:hypothetical protein TI03_06450, partial [Achromatium sp. WMS1]